MSLHRHQIAAIIFQRMLLMSKTARAISNRAVMQIRGSNTISFKTKSAQSATRSGRGMTMMGIIREAGRSKDQTLAARTRASGLFWIPILMMHLCKAKTAATHSISRIGNRTRKDSVILEWGKLGLTQVALIVWRYQHLNILAFWLKNKLSHAKIIIKQVKFYIILSIFFFFFLFFWAHKNFTICETIQNDSNNTTFIIDKNKSDCIII